MKNRATIVMSGWGFPKHIGRKMMVLAVLTLLLQGCSTVTIRTGDGGEKTMTIEEFRKYSEEVFRRQNRASDQVIMLSEEVDPATYQKLAETEEQMLEACGPLNEIAARQRDQESVGLSLKLEIAPTIDACDRATAHLEALLRTVRQ
jgi:RNA 3'-terminal phosphate cyclase